MIFWIEVYDRIEKAKFYIYEYWLRKYFVSHKIFVHQLVNQKLYYIGLLNAEQEYHPHEMVNDQLESITYDKQWEFPRRKLKLGIKNEYVYENNWE